MAIEPYSVAGDAALKAHFPSHRPTQRDVFEIAIAASGGTSTGAYIGGVLDFIIEAFERLTEAQQAGEAPLLPVRLVNLTGASAGGLSISLAALMAVRQCPHVNGRTSTPQDEADNPLYDAWVKRISLEKLLTAPPPGSVEAALFHPEPVAIKDAIFAALNARPTATARSWLADPLEVRVTVGNLRGVPYALDFPLSGVGPADLERFDMHRDHMGFSVLTAALGGRPDGPGPAPDTYALDPLTPLIQGDWLTLGDAAVASSSIPVVFPTHEVNRHPAAYDWRGSYWDNPLGPSDPGGRAALDLPAWAPAPDPPFTFTATDGGVFDNAPFDLAHMRLAGARGQNPSDADNVCRTVILIDPLVDETAHNAANPTSLLGSLLAMVMGPIAQSRLGALDMSLIKDESVYSRFMIAPSRESPDNRARTWGPSLSLMTAPLHAILGFASEAYRRHDFLLGRRNAQQFLSQHFTLPANHWLFTAHDPEWARANTANFTRHATHRQIIPLFGSAAEPQALPAWDWEALTEQDIAKLGKQAARRIKGVITGALAKPSGSREAFLAWLPRVTWRAFVNLVWPVLPGPFLSRNVRTMLVNARATLDPTSPNRK